MVKRLGKHNITPPSPTQPKYRHSEPVYSKRLLSEETKKLIENLKDKERTKEKNALIAMTTESVVDKYSRIIFPTVFIIFNIAYWITYLQRKKSTINSNFFCGVDEEDGG